MFDISLPSKNESDPPAKTIMRSVAVGLLRPGLSLCSPIYSELGAKLVDSGVTLDNAMLVSLRKQGETVFVSQDDLARLNAFRPQGMTTEVPPLRRHTRNPLTTKISEQLDSIADAGEYQVDVEGTPLLQSLTPRTAAPYSTDVRSRFLVEHESAVADVENVIQKLANEEPTGLAPLEAAVLGAMDRVCEDIDLFLALIANPYYTRSVGRNSYHVACLAISIGVYLGLDRRALVELGMGCTVHDIGMLYLEDSSHLRKRRLGAAEFVSITNHPIHTMTALNPYCSQLAPASRMVAYQVHERCDGSGYPRGRAAEQIHDLAKIAAVADSYIAMVSPRPHRDGIVPYYAIRSLLRDVQIGLYDSRGVRGLLHALSLFPIGSFVGLTPRLVGRVIRSNVENYDQPIVEVWDVRRLNAVPAVVDLSQCDISISEAIDPSSCDAKWKEILESIGAADSRSKAAQS